MALMTLGNYRDFSSMLFGEDSKQVKFFDKKIAEHGRDEPVLTDENQMMYLLMSMDDAS